MIRAFTSVMIVIALLNTAHGAENVHMSAGFETGQFQSAEGYVDAFFVRTLPNPQNGDAVINTGAGGGGPGSNWDTKVIRSEAVAGQKVTPRQGSFFVRSVIDVDKDYSGLNGGLPKPRSALSLTSDAHRFEFDEEGWLGLSVFIPKNFEDETRRQGPGGSIEMIVVNSDSDAYFFNINIYVPPGESKAHWVLQYSINDSQLTSGERNNFVIGPVDPDKGKWTDFVIRYRSNPFSKDTNPANAGIKRAKNRLYKANKGILQIWKAEGAVLAGGDRKMNRVFSILNAPVGNVPGTVQGKSLLHHSLRVYKYGWQRQDTSVAGPIWIGYDEFRYGQTLKDGTGYRDVHPSGRACSDKCPSGSTGATSQPNLAPRPPANVTVTR